MKLRPHMKKNNHGWRDIPIQCKICKELFLPITRKNIICPKRECKHLHHYNISKSRHRGEGITNVKRKIKRYTEFLEKHGCIILTTPYDHSYRN